MTALPQTLHLTAYRGDTWAATLELVEADGTPANLTGATVANAVEQQLALVADLG